MFYLLSKIVLLFSKLRERVSRRKFSRDEILLLLPRCLQWSRCKENLVENIENCKRCGRCRIKDILEIKEKYNIDCKMATGGQMALEEAKKEKYKVIVAVACEKELAMGICSVFPKPVVHIANIVKTPCKDTDVDIKLLESKILKVLKDEEGTSL